MTNKFSQPNELTQSPQLRSGERGAALVFALIILLLLGAISVTVLAVVSHEIKIASSDLRRTETYSAAASAIESMTNQFSALFQRTSNPSQGQLDAIATNLPTELTAQGFKFTQSLKLNTIELTRMQLTQGITDGSYPYVDIEKGSLAGLRASVSPYIVTATAYNSRTGAKVTLERTINNYLIPMFQFGTFSDGDLEFWPQPPMTFNGRVHANGNIYFGGDITFTSKVTTANEAVRTLLRNNGTLPAAYSVGTPRFVINGTVVSMSKGSVVGGPKLPQPRTDQRGNFPVGHPTGTDNAAWNVKSVMGVAPATPDQFGGQLLTKGTGGLPLLLPMQLDGKMPREIIKRPMPDDSSALVAGRFSSKAEIRILIDDEIAGNGSGNVAGIGNDTSGTQKGKKLSSFDPSPLNGGNALRLVKDDGSGYVNSTDWLQGKPSLSKKAETVRGIKAYSVTGTSINSVTGGKNANTTTELAANTAPKSPNGAIIPPGSGITGRILIEVRKADGTWVDVTSTILSMGMTVGEPNGIVYLQRPLWAAYMQGGRDRKADSNHNNYLNYFLDTSVTDRRCIADGEVIKTPAFNSTGFIYEHDNTLDDDPHSGSTRCLPTAATMARDDQFSTAPGSLNKIVPISLYNVREGRIDENASSAVVYERGIVSVIDINMRNLARWVDGVFDNNLLQGTNAVSSNIDGTDGYVVYISDRRGDRVKAERNSLNLTINTTNGLVDNEDVYGYNRVNGDTPDPGEDVIDAGYDMAALEDKKGSLQIDLKELPSPAPIAIPASTPAPPSGVDATDFTRSVVVSEWHLPTNASPFIGHPEPSSKTAAAPGYYFRRAVRVLNGEDLKLTGATGKLSATKGITIATENMIYIWGNYNTTGINGQPANGSTPNDPSQLFSFQGDQVPSAIVSDAFFPLSKTWYDAMPALYPEGSASRVADTGSLTDITGILPTEETSVRAGIISGTTMSAMVGTTAPAYYLQWLNGGVHNFPRFLETWGNGTTWNKRWNYTGSFILLYNSTQAVGPYSVISSVVYYPPIRNWGFDITFNDPKKLPPGTPQFQYIEATGFRQVF